MNPLIKLLRSERFIYFIVPFICFIFYSGLLLIGHAHFDTHSHASYFKDLAYSFLHSRLDIDRVGTGGDLVFYDDKFYLYWPPVPALVYMPLVALFGLHLPDAIINALSGAVSVYLFMRVMYWTALKFSIPLARKEIVWLGLFWGLGTVLFYMSMPGTVWFIAQVMAQTFLLASVLVFLRTDSVRGYFLSGFWLAMTIYTRNDLVFAFIFFIFLYFAKASEKKITLALRNAIVLMLPFIVFSILNLWYNYARFGNVWENGIAFHRMSPYFFDNYKHWGYFSFHYISYNFYVEVLRAPQFIFKWPFIKYDPEGFGFFWASPFFLLLVPALVIYLFNLFKPKIFTAPDLIAMSGAILSIIPIAIVIFMVMGTGWSQFGARYTLDFQFFIIFLLVFFYKPFHAYTFLRYAAVLLICISMIINYCGAILFYITSS